MKRNELLRSIILMAIIVVLTAGAAFGLNFVTGPKIEADAKERAEKEAAAQLGSLAEVFPNATGFKDITTTLTISDAGVTAVYEETSGLGYAFIATKPGYQGHAVTVTVGVQEGIIVGIKVEVAAGDWEVKAPTLESYIGSDSTLSGVLFSGATFSEGGAKDAVTAGLLVLTENDLMKAASKAAEQVFEELLPTVTSGFLKGQDLTASGNIYQAYTSLNKSVVVSYVNKGENKLLAVTNVSGVTKVYKANLVDEKTQVYELLDVTSENADVVSEVNTFAASTLTSSLSKITTKVTTLYPNATEITELTLDTFSTLLGGVSFVEEGNTYYIFFAKTYSFSNEMMEVYVVLDSEGKIVKTDYNTFFFEEEYFMTKPNLDKNSYLGGLNGITGETLADQTLVSGATMSSNALKQALQDAFAQFASQGGNN